MAQGRSYRAVGAALLVIGVVFLALAFFGGQSALHIPGATLAFFGVVLLARAKRRVQEPP